MLSYGSPFEGTDAIHAPPLSADRASKALPQFLPYRRNRATTFSAVRVCVCVCVSRCVCVCVCV
jgi:hypothetical protein